MNFKSLLLVFLAAGLFLVSGIFSFFGIPGMINQEKSEVVILRKNATLTDATINGPVLIWGDNVLLRNCQIDAGGTEYAIYIMPGLQNVQLLDLDIENVDKGGMRILTNEEAFEPGKIIK